MNDKQKCQEVARLMRYAVAYLEAAAGLGKTLSDQDLIFAGSNLQELTREIRTDLTAWALDIGRTYGE